MTEADRKEVAALARALATCSRRANEHSCMANQAKLVTIIASASAALCAFLPAMAHALVSDWWLMAVVALGAGLCWWEAKRFRERAWLRANQLYSAAPKSYPINFDGVFELPNPDYSADRYSEYVRGL